MAEEEPRGVELDIEEFLGGGSNLAPSVPLAEQKAGFVALIGAPNAGKSTLINQLVGTKVSIVSHKVQTTRTTVRGIVMHSGSQIIFVDTPGIFQPRRRLDRAMVDAAWGGAKDADITTLLIDAERGIKGDAERILEALKNRQGTRILLLNKIDRVRSDELLALIAKANEIVEFDHTFMVSALKGTGCKDYLDCLAELMPQGPWLYPPEQVSDFPTKMMAAEVTREKLYLRLHQELPYSAHVETESWEEKKDGSVRIGQVIYIQRDAHKKIVIGKKGETIKAISRQSRAELKELLDRDVHLFLFVKVRENWIDDPERYQEMGLQFPK
ncbi:GTPase Era [Pseudahrensia aquimaris]|uniref:GTPase Era n=1 Tax=Pseudahrensia aquimaris TaxID=744461 RepID=A0ABW3FBD2_9HYPH